MNITNNPGIYIHVPFCRSKCGYCDFYSTTELSLRKSFQEAVIKDILRSSAIHRNSSNFDTVYFGGGTPSQLSISALNSILDTLISSFRMRSDCEITLEINPGNLTRSKLKDWKAAGINRLSIGIQSFKDAELQTLQRLHSSKQAVNAITWARDTGFENISLDLIYALPGQTLNDWAFSLQKAILYNPEHISAYNLHYVEGTPFYSKMIEGTLKAYTQEQESAFFNLSRVSLEDSGYLQYEISNFTKFPGTISRHNYKYWRHTPYLAFGPAAHSFWNNRRWANVASIRQYIQLLKKNKSPVSFVEKLAPKQLKFEYIFLSLRTAQGINLNEFKSRYKKDFLKQYASAVTKLLRLKLAELSDRHFKLTQKGMLLCDEILPGFA